MRTRKGGAARWRVGVLAAAVALTWAAAAAAARPTQVAAPTGNPPDQGGHVFVEKYDERYGPWQLPPNYSKADGSFHQGLLVAQQKRRLAFLNERLSAGLGAIEMPHFLLLTQVPKNVASQAGKWAESLYADLCRQFGVKGNAQVWDGKCLLLLFAAEEDYGQHAWFYDQYRPRQRKSYSAWEMRGANEPQLTHLCFLVARGNLGGLKQAVHHEVTHAFFNHYRRPVKLPLWLHEGLAQYMTVVNDKTARKVRLAGARSFVGREAEILVILRKSWKATLAPDAYYATYTLVDCLMQIDEERFQEFVDALKDGKEQDEALKEAYNFGEDEFAKRWGEYAAKSLPR